MSFLLPVMGVSYSRKGVVFVCFLLPVMGVSHSRTEVVFVCFLQQSAGVFVYPTPRDECHCVRVGEDRVVSFQNSKLRYCSFMEENCVAIIRRKTGFECR